MTIGTWKHPPNRDGVHWLCVHIWPAIRQQLPDAQLHIYGSHMSGAAQHYHKPVGQVCRPPTTLLCCSDQLRQLQTDASLREPLLSVFAVALLDPLHSLCTHKSLMTKHMCRQGNCVLGSMSGTKAGVA